MDLRARLERLRTSRPDRPARRTDPPPDLPPRVETLPLTCSLGDQPLHGLRPSHPRLGWLAGCPPPPPDRPVVLLDTETTGLAGGTGTLIFLIGLGSLPPGGTALTLTQTVLADPSAERAFLEPARAELAAAGLVICFNGRTFDLPLLQTRLTLAGLPPLPAGLPVLDLLPPARRLWRHRLESCSLQSLERSVLNFHRRGDLPGAEAPARYFEYLRTRDPAGLEEVVTHNRIDILAMAALTAGMAERLAPGPHADPDALCGLLEAIRTRGERTRFEILWAEDAPALRAAAARHARLALALAGWLKRSGRRDEAYEMHLRLAEDRPLDAPEAIEAVLIHEEHRLRDPVRALHRCHRYAARARGRPGQAGLSDRLRVRLARLERKAASQSGEVSD